jgi:hypothetical protein
LEKKHKKDTAENAAKEEGTFDEEITLQTN